MASEAQSEAGKLMKLSLIYRAGVACLRPIADTWGVGAEARLGGRDMLIAVALVAGIILAAIIAGR